MRLTAFLLGALVLIMCSTCVVAYDSLLSGSLGNDLPLSAEATPGGSIWTYIYTATITGVAVNVTGFSIGNPLGLEFTEATNNKNFTNPVYTGSDSILWYGGSVPKDQGPIIFTFKSTHVPKISVPATLYGSIKYSGGNTLGLAVPEPASMTALGALAFGGAAALYRRRRSRRS